MLRSQYHFRDSNAGLLAWDVRRLIELSAQFSVHSKPIEDIAEMQENHWFAHVVPTCARVLEHMQLIEQADLDYPLILDASGRVMDGMHRVCKARHLGLQEVLYVQFAQDPEPDYVGRDPADLPYD